MNQSRLFKAVVAGLWVGSLSVAQAAEAVPELSATATPVAPPAGPKPPYSLPWQLRPATALTVVRSDTSIAFYDAKDATMEDKSGSSVATTFLASYKLAPTWAPVLRLAMVQNSTPNVGGTKEQPDATSFVNPLLGLTYATNVGVLKVAGCGAVTIPIGQGGGDTPNPGNKTAAGAGVPARSAMDNAMFAVNYFTMIAGGDVAYVAHKVTLQAELTLLELIKARGPEAGQRDKRTNLTAGFHAGYFLAPMISLGTEIRYQRWLTDPNQPVNPPLVAPTNTRDSVTVAFGPRFHFKVGDHWLRPGVSYSRFLDEPFSKSHYQMLQVDVPFAF